jgi:hypothetical protein
MVTITSDASKRRFHFGQEGINKAFEAALFLKEDVLAQQSRKEHLRS